MRWAIICTTALLIGFISGHFVARPFFTPSVYNAVPAVQPIPLPQTVTPTSTVPTVPETPVATSSPTTTIQFSVPLMYSIDQTVTYPDGLMVTVTAINDSRCKPDVQCIWAGELSPQLTLTGGELGKSVVLMSLGTIRTTNQSANDYIIALETTTVTTVTLTITKKTPATTVTTQANKTPSTNATTITKSPTPVVAQSKPKPDLAVEVVRLLTEATKKLRIEQSLSSYMSDTKLAASAKKYSAKLLKGNYLAHIDTDGCDLTCRFSESGYQASSWGENLAMMEYDEEPSAEYIATYFMTQWQKSDGHRKNILSPVFTNQGIGVSVQNGKIYVVVHFALPL
jgi:uncharacterized protein YkwD